MKPSVRPTVAGVALACLALSCGGGGGGAYGGATAPNPPAATTPTTSDPGTTVVGILGDRGASSFAPDPVTVKMGQKVAWKSDVERDVAQRPGHDPLPLRHPPVDDGLDRRPVGPVRTAD